MALNRGGKPGFPGHYGVHDAFQSGVGGAKGVKSHSIAWRTELSMGRMLSRVDLEAAHVSTEHQLRQALMRVALAVPSGVMTLEKALLMCLKV